MPGTMTLLGNANWWPVPLCRLEAATVCTRAACPASSTYPAGALAVPTGGL